MFFLILCSCSTSRVYSDEMKKELKSMFIRDQNLQDWDQKRLSDKKYIDSMNIQLQNLIRRNTEIVKEYNKVYGYPKIMENGEKTEKYFWLVVQHSDHDLIFQEKVLEEMRKNIPSGNANKQNYAYLYDRIKKNKKLPQLYGTQVEYSGWDVVPYKLKYPQKVEQLRKEAGLDSLKIYLKSFQK